MFRAACMLLEFLLNDKTQPIITASLGFLENLICEFIFAYDYGQNKVHDSCDNTFYMLSIDIFALNIATIGQKVEVAPLKCSILPIMSLVIGKTTSTNTRIRESSGQALTLLATQTVRFS
jgi:hypothetical protein